MVITLILTFCLLLSPFQLNHCVSAPFMFPSWSLLSYSCLFPYYKRNCHDPCGHTSLHTCWVFMWDASWKRNIWVTVCVAFYILTDIVKLSFKKLYQFLPSPQTVWIPFFPHLLEHYENESVSCSVVSDSLWPHGL